MNVQKYEKRRSKSADCDMFMVHQIRKSVQFFRNQLLAFNNQMLNNHHTNNNLLYIRG